MTSIPSAPFASVAPAGLRRAAAATATAFLALLAGCATPPRPLAGNPTVYSGKIGVRSDASPGQDARSVSGQFELSGSPTRGELVLTGPLGTTVARARWRPAGNAGPDDAGMPEGGAADIELQADGHTRHFSDFDAMTHAALGQSLPLAAMFDWLAGRPWPHSPAAFDAGRAAFDQLGWHVDRARYDADRLVVADRALPPPALHVRVKLDDDPVRAQAPAAAASPATPAASRAPTPAPATH